MIQFTREVPSDWTLETLFDFIDGESDRVSAKARIDYTYNETAEIVVRYKDHIRVLRVTANPKPIASRED